MKITGKKLLLFGFVFVLLVGIPVTVYLVQQQQQTRSKAQKSTALTFVPDSSAQTPIQKKVGDSIPLDINVNPGSNLVSFVKLEINYDPDKLATADANAFQPNTIAFPTVLEGPIYTPGKIAVTLSVGPDPTKAIQTIAKAATVNFKALANTPDGTPTLVTYGTATQVLSIGSSDQASENVLSTTSPATIVIGGSIPSGSGTPEPIPTGTPSPTPEITITETPVPSDTLTPTPTVATTATPSLTITPTLTGSPTGSPSANQSPICNNLAVDRATTGIVPFSITFGANGNDNDGTINKVTFNFGDGQVSDVTTGGGVGTNVVNVQIAHTYNNPGTFQASALLTDNGGAVSSTTNCQQTIIAQAPAGVGGSTPTPTATGSALPTPTMAATGSVSTAVGIGAAALLLMIGGGILFFIL